MSGQTGLVHEPIKPFIGSRVLNTKQELLGGALASALRELLEQRGVLVFPQLGLSDEEQIAFTQTLGKFQPERTGERVFKVTLDDKVNPYSAEYLKGSLYWHLDGTMSPVPILASLLTSKKLASWGGNTGFCNTYAAYEQLPVERRAELEGLRVMHAAWASLFYYEPEPSLAKLKGMQAIGERELPLLWKHRSGRKSLVLGCTAHHVIGVSAAKSAELLTGLREWATSEPFSYSHAWKVGDLVMWDNTGTLHRAEPYDLESGRLLHRTKLEGEGTFRVTLGLFDLSGKVVLATGANSGIGLGFLQGCARHGADVVVWGRRADKNEEAVAALKQLGAPRAHAEAVDVADEAQVKRAFVATLTHMGRVDCVFANAGFSHRAESFVDLSSEDYHALLNVNLHGAFYTLREGARHMRERAQRGDPGGSLVACGSLSMFHGLQGMEHYAAAKGALSAMIKGLAVELGRYGVRANMLAPGFILTGMMDEARVQALSERFSAITPLGRPGELADIEGPAVYLASDASRFHTGDILVVDGGRLVRSL